MPRLIVTAQRPRDVVHSFLECVDRQDYEEAEEFFFKDSRVLETGMTFSEFAERFDTVDLSTVSISREFEGKGGFTMVYIVWSDDEGERHWDFGFKLIDGSWRIARGYAW